MTKKEKQEKCDMCERGIAHIGPSCFSYYRNTSSNPHRLPKDEVKIEKLNGSYVLYVLTDKINEIIDLLNSESK